MSITNKPGTQQASSESELRERCKQFGSSIIVTTEREKKWVELTFAELTPEEQESWIKQWTLWRSGGWEGPFRRGASVEEKGKS